MANKNKKGVLKKIDVFGYVPEILYNGESGFSSNYGGVVTLIVVFAYCLTMSFGLWRYFQRDSPETNVNRVYISDPVGFNVTIDSLPIAFGQQDVDGLHFIDPTVYTVTATYNRFVKYTKNGKIETDYGSYNISLTECSNLNLEKGMFKNLELENMWCFKDYTAQGVPLELTGVWESDVYGFINIRLNRCTGVGCKTPKEIDDIIESGYFAANYINRETRTSHYENPVEKYPTSFFTTTSSFYRKSMQMRMANNELTTGNTLMSYLAPKTEEFCSVASLNTELTKFESDVTKKTPIYYDLVIRMDPLKNVTKRQYLTLYDYIADFGGLAQVITIIGLALTFRTKKHQLCVDLAKQICYREQKYQEVLSAHKDNKGDEEYSMTQKSRAHPVIKVQSNKAGSKGHPGKTDNHKSQASTSHIKNQAEIYGVDKARQQKPRDDTRGRRRSEVTDNMDVPEDDGGAQQVRHAMLYTPPMLAKSKQTPIVKKKHGAYQEASKDEKKIEVQMAANIDLIKTPENLSHSDDNAKPACSSDYQITKGTRPVVEDYIKSSTVNHRGEQNRYTDMKAKLKQINGWMVFLYSYFPCLTKKTNTTAVVEMVEKEVFGRYDLLKILDLYEEMKKFRFLLMTPDQRLLFDLIPSTKLALNNNTMKKTFTLTSHINQTNRQTEGETASSDYSSVLTAYQRILQQDSHSEMDRNLLRNLGFLYGQAIKNSSELIDCDFADG